MLGCGMTHFAQRVNDAGHPHAERAFDKHHITRLELVTEHHGHVRAAFGPQALFFGWQRAKQVAHQWADTKHTVDGRHGRQLCQISMHLCFGRAQFLHVAQNGDTTRVGGAGVRAAVGRAVRAGLELQAAGRAATAGFEREVQKEARRYAVARKFAMHWREVTRHGGPRRAAVLRETAAAWRGSGRVLAGGDGAGW